MTHSELSGMIIEVAIDVDRRLGPGLLESVYQTILAHELIKRGLNVRKEEPIPLIWDNLRFDIGFRADLIVNDLILIELKSIEQLAAVLKKTGAYLPAHYRTEARSADQLWRGNFERWCEADHQWKSRGGRVGSH